MILKEAFRYQNYLTQLKNDISRFLYKDENILKREERLLYSSVNKDKEDEVEVRVGEFDMDKVLELIDTVIAEKEGITKAISKTKTNCEYDIDALLEVNKFKASFIESLEVLNNIKSKEVKTTNTDYKFNVNGEQLAYRFPTTIIETINFDRNKTKGMANTLSRDTDNVSNLIDRLNVTLEVDFEPKFNIKDSLEDILSSL